MNLKPIAIRKLRQDGWKTIIRKIDNRLAAIEASLRAARYTIENIGDRRRVAVARADEQRLKRSRSFLRVERREAEQQLRFSL